MKQCIRVRVLQYPDILEWEFNDGSIEVTDHLDLGTVEGRHLVAGRALDVGVDARSKGDIVEHLEMIPFDAGKTIFQAGSPLRDSPPSD